MLRISQLLGVSLRIMVGYWDHHLFYIHRWLPVNPWFQDRVGHDRKANHVSRELGFCLNCIGEALQAEFNCVVNNSII